MSIKNESKSVTLYSRADVVLFIIPIFSFVLLVLGMVGGLLAIYLLLFRKGPDLLGNLEWTKNNYPFKGRKRIVTSSLLLSVIVSIILFLGSYSTYGLIEWFEIEPFHNMWSEDAVQTKLSMWTLYFILPLFFMFLFGGVFLKFSVFRRRYLAPLFPIVMSIGFVIGSALFFALYECHYNGELMELPSSIAANLELEYYIYTIDKIKIFSDSYVNDFQNSTNPFFDREYLSDLLSFRSDWLGIPYENRGTIYYGFNQFEYMGFLKNFLDLLGPLILLIAALTGVIKDIELDA